MVTGERVLRELAAIGFSRVTDYMEIADGQLTIRDTQGLSEAQQAAVASMERGTGGVKIKFHDKLRALEMLGKVTGLYEGGAVQQENNLLQAILAATEGELDHGELTVDN